MTDMQKDIWEAAVYPMSATTLAHAVGKSKAASIQSDIDALVSEGYLTADNSGRYVLYKKANRTATRSASRTTTAPATTTSVEHTVVETNATTKLPAGYKAGKLRQDSQGRNVRTIQLPNGDRKALLEGYTLININEGEKVCQVQNVADAFTVAAQFARDKGMTAWKIETNGGSIKSTRDIVPQCGIVDLRIEPVNKPA